MPLISAASVLLQLIHRHGPQYAGGAVRLAERRYQTVLGFTAVRDALAKLEAQGCLHPQRRPTPLGGTARIYYHLTLQGVARAERQRLEVARVFRFRRPEAATSPP